MCTFIMIYTHTMMKNMVDLKLSFIFGLISLYGNTVYVHHRCRCRRHVVSISLPSFLFLFLSIRVGVDKIEKDFFFVVVAYFVPCSYY